MYLYLIRIWIKTVNKLWLFNLKLNIIHLNYFIVGEMILSYSKSSKVNFISRPFFHIMSPAMICCVVSCHGALCCIVLSCIVLYLIMLCCIKFYWCAMLLFCVVLCCATMRCVVSSLVSLCCVKFYFVTLCCAMLCCAEL